VSRHRVPNGELHTIFKDEVMPFVFRNHRPAERPELVLLGAQPAAGKSKAQASIFRSHPTVVPLSGDALRRFHPHYDALMEHHPLAMPNATAQASGAWVGMSIDHARQNGYSLLLEGIFRDPDMTMGTAREFAESGYQVHVVALGVDERVSRLDSVNRYLSPGPDANRWTPATAHDLGYRMSPHTVQAAEDSPHVHRITITDRAGQDLFTNTRTPHGGWSGPTGAKDALLASRERPLDPDEARTWLSRREDYTAALISRGELGPLTQPTLERLHADADTAARQAWPAPEDSRQRERHSSQQRLHRHLLDSVAVGVPNDLPPHVARDARDVDDQ
jgi:UDP-N-acetylglucosamine kinase